MSQVKVIPSPVLATCQVLYGTYPSYPDIFPKECSRILDPREQQLPLRMPRGFLEGTRMGRAESNQTRQSRVADRRTLHAQTRDGKQLPGSKESWTVPTLELDSPHPGAGCLQGSLLSGQQATFCWARVSNSNQQESLFPSKSSKGEGAPFPQSQSLGHTFCP